MSLPSAWNVQDPLWPVDVYKAGRLAAHLWREDGTVTFRYRSDYVDAGHPPVAFTLPVSPLPVQTELMRVPPFFAGLLPEGDSRRRQIQRAFHLAGDDELALLSLVGADTVGDVQVVPAGEPLPQHAADGQREWTSVSFRDMWTDLSGTGVRSALPGVHAKMSAHSRSLHGGPAGPVILKLALEGWHGVVRNEELFMSHAPHAGLAAPPVRTVRDRDGAEALEVVRFDRTVIDGHLRRHAQEDASQVLGLRPGQKYDPDARTVVSALASVCASPKLAARVLFHQLAYSYVVGNNDVHAKNLSVREDPVSGLWTVTPVYDVLHTWPYEEDHRFLPAIRDDGPHDTVTLRHWLAFAEDIALPEKAARTAIRQVLDSVPRLLDRLDAADLPSRIVRDVRSVVAKRVRNLGGASAG